MRTLDLGTENGRRGSVRRRAARAEVTDQRRGEVPKVAFARRDQEMLDFIRSQHHK